MNLNKEYDAVVEYLSDYYTFEKRIYSRVFNLVKALPLILNIEN